MLWGWVYTKCEGWGAMRMWTSLYCIWQRRLLSDVIPLCMWESMKFTLFPTRDTHTPPHRRNQSKLFWDQLSDLINLILPSRGIAVLNMLKEYMVIQAKIILCCEFDKFVSIHKTFQLKNAYDLFLCKGPTCNRLSNNLHLSNNDCLVFNVFWCC